MVLLLEGGGRRSSRSALVLRAAIPTLILGLSRLQAVAAESPYDDTDGGSSCDVLDTLCLDQIDHKAGGFILELFLFFWCFLALAIVCDDYLVASLETLCVRWSIREDVAGCTFMAFGSAAPEIIVNAVATIKAGADTGSGSGSGGSGSSSTDLGIAAIIGSGMIAFMLIPGLCGLFGPQWVDGKELPLQLKRRPLIRDVGTYATGLLQLSLFFADGEIHLWEATIMVSTYVAYVVLVITAPKIRKAWRLKYATDEDQGLLKDKLDDIDSDEEDWKQPRACKRDRITLRRARPLVMTDRIGRRLVFPPVGKTPDSSTLRSAFARVLASSVRVDSNTVQRAVQEDPEFKQMLVEAGVNDPDRAVTRAFGGFTAPVLITPESFEHALVTEERPSVFSIDGADQPALRSARLVLSSNNPRIEITPGQPIFLSADASCYRYLAQLERWLKAQPHVSSSLEYEEGAKVDGWFYDRYIPATVRVRHHDGTYDVDWEDGTFSQAVPFKDLAPRNIKDARNSRQEFIENSNLLQKCLESGALSQAMYQEALEDLRDRTYGEGGGVAGRSPIPINVISPRTEGTERRGSVSRAGTSRPGSPKNAAARSMFSADYSMYSGGSALSVWRRQWFKEEEIEDELKDLPLWRWPIQLTQDFLVGFWQVVFKMTIPDTALAEEGAEPNPLEKYYPVAFVISFLWVAVFSFIISTIASRWADLSGLGNGFLGLLLVSSGAEIPDCIQSITVAKRGFGSMATSNAIGSQNVNVLIGLGLPWLMYNAAVGKTVKVDGHKSLQVAAFFQCGAIALNLFLLIGLAVITGEKKAQLGSKKGYMLCAAYFVVLTGFALYDQLG